MVVHSEPGLVRRAKLVELLKDVQRRYLVTTEVPVALLRLVVRARGTEELAPYLVQVDQRHP